MVYHEPCRQRRLLLPIVTYISTNGPRVSQTRILGLVNQPLLAMYLYIIILLQRSGVVAPEPDNQPCTYITPATADHILRCGPFRLPPHPRKNSCDAVASMYYRSVHHLCLAYAVRGWLIGWLVCPATVWSI